MVNGAVGAETPAGVEAEAAALEDAAAERSAVVEDEEETGEEVAGGRSGSGGEAAGGEDEAGARTAGTTSSGSFADLVCDERSGEADFPGLATEVSGEGWGDGRAGRDEKLA